VKTIAKIAEIAKKSPKLKDQTSEPNLHSASLEEQKKIWIGFQFWHFRRSWQFWQSRAPFSSC